mgnify:CR=1 FL=1
MAESENKTAEINEVTELGQTRQGSIHCLSIIGQIEGHQILPEDVKTTKYEHVLPLLAALVITVVDALPVFGTGTVLAPWAAVECLLGNVPKGAALLALFAVISVVRSVLEPKLVAAQAGLPPLASLAAMYVGFCAAGVAGMVLAPVLLLLVKQLRDGGYIRLWR